MPLYLVFFCNFFFFSEGFELLHLLLFQVISSLKDRICSSVIWQGSFSAIGIF